MLKCQKLALVKNSKSLKIKFLWNISGNQLSIFFFLIMVKKSLGKWRNVFNWKYFRISKISLNRGEESKKLSGSSTKGSKLPQVPDKV